MQVQRPLGSEPENLVAKQLTIIEREDKIGRHRADLIHPERVVHVIGGEDGNPLDRGQFGDTVEPDCLAGVIAVGKDRGDLDPGAQKCLDTNTTDIVVGENDGFHRNFLAMIHILKLIC